MSSTSCGSTPTTRKPCRGTSFTKPSSCSISSPSRTGVELMPMALAIVSMRR